MARVFTPVFWKTLKKPQKTVKKTSKKRQKNGPKTPQKHEKHRFIQLFHKKCCFYTFFIKISKKIGKIFVKKCAELPWKSGFLEKMKIVLDYCLNESRKKRVFMIFVKNKKFYKKKSVILDPFLSKKNANRNRHHSGSIAFFTFGFTEFRRKNT